MSSLSWWRVWLGYTLIFLAVFWPVVTNVYGHSDEFVYINAGGNPAIFNSLWIAHLVMGRPTVGLLHGLFFSNAHCIADLAGMRAAGIVFLACLAMLLYRALINNGWRVVTAFCLPVIMLCMPPWQVYISMAMVSLCPLACVASTLAVLLSDRIANQQGATRRVVLLLLAACLQLIATTIHQSAAMFFWVVVAINSFGVKNSLSSLRARCLRYVGVFTLATILALGVWWLGKQSSPSGLSPERQHLTHHVWQKIVWFFHNPMLDALNLDHLFPSYRLAIGIGVFIAVGICIYLRGNLKERLFQVALAAILIPLSYLPNLVIAENWSAYRTQSGLSALIVFYLFIWLY